MYYHQDPKFAEEIFAPKLRIVGVANFALMFCVAARSTNKLQKISGSQYKISGRDTKYEIITIKLHSTGSCILPPPPKKKKFRYPTLLATFLTFWPQLMVGPGPLIILKNILSQMCSRTIFEKHTAPGAHSKHAPGVVCISNMVLKHIWLRKFFQIMNSPEP